MRWLILLVIFFVSCSIQRVNTTDQNIESTDSHLLSEPPSVSKTINVVLKGKDLSEDLSVVSTKNDEILLLIYTYPTVHLNSAGTSETLDAPVLVSKANIDQYNREHSAQWSITNYDQEKRFLLLLIEQDEQTPIEQLDPIIRVNHRSILKAYQGRDYSGLKKYLGDEDLLGVCFIDSKEIQKEEMYSFRGVHKLDKYDYTVRLMN